MADPKDYPAAPAIARTSASTRGWGPGWPNCQPGKLMTLARNDGLKLPVRAELAELVALLMDETERRGYDIKVGQTWGFACRAIGGTSTPSNHSWGLAVDINAPSNPFGSAFVTDMPPWMPALWWDYKFFWGGWYGSVKDAMHYEFLGTPADAASLTEKAKKALGKPYPSFGEKSERVRKAQAQLKKLGFDPGPIDGIFGSKTKAAVAAFERSRYNGRGDGLFGPLTWGLLFKAKPAAAPTG